MNEFQRSETERLLFALLKMALHEQKEGKAWSEISEKTWKECLRLAVEQGVVALAWDGVQAAGVKLSKELWGAWYMAVYSCEVRHEKYCRVASELFDMYSQNGIAMAQLKGVGFSVNYPVPAHREGGDIDIYTWSADKNARSDREANELADQLMRGLGIEVDTKHSSKHSNFYYKGIPVENHKTFLNVGSYSLAKPMNDLLLEQLDPREVTLYGSKWNVPSPRFDALFLALHAMQHYGCGMRLHHLLDWACLLKKYGWCVPDEVKDQRLLRFMYGLTRLCNEFLGLRVAVGDDEGISREMLAAMLHPRYEEKVPVRGKGAILLYKTRRLLYQHSLQRKAVGDSLRRRLWRSIVAHVRAPHTIFLTGREK